VPKYMSPEQCAQVLHKVLRTPPKRR
jgi:hypothetical protein